jgi:predicted component of type VI protein secretion system
VSLSRTYVPNEFTIWLSPKDRSLYEAVESEVIDELAGYLLEHARREDLTLASPPHIAFQTDGRLKLGEFGIQARLTAPPKSPVESAAPVAPVAPARPQAPTSRPPAPPEDPQSGRTMIYSTSARLGEPAREVRSLARAPRALLVGDGRTLIVPPAGAVIGRSSQCDIVLDDSGVSRRHAEIRPQGSAWILRDLGSTNGVLVDGAQVAGEHRLADGERIAFGSTDLRFQIS